MFEKSKEIFFSLGTEEFYKDHNRPCKMYHACYSWNDYVWTVNMVEMQKPASSLVKITSGTLSRLMYTSRQQEPVYNMKHQTLLLHLFRSIELWWMRIVYPRISLLFLFIFFHFVCSFLVLLDGTIMGENQFCPLSFRRDSLGSYKLR